MAQPSSNRSIRVEGNTTGSVIVSGDGNTVYSTVYVTLQGLDQDTPRTEEESNPYKGISAFKEKDAKYYFGRELQVEHLWQRFQFLFKQTPYRVLPILGPSGCGKSSLARAGLIPEIARRPLPGKEQTQVIVLVPGRYPLESLAGVLARAITQDSAPVEKAAEFERVLRQANSSGEFDGLRRITTQIPAIYDSPLVVLVDQFEEVYAPPKEEEARAAFLTDCKIFIETLLNAASDSAGLVSLLFTLRSDFLGEAQRHPILNKVCSEQGFLVPAMNSFEMRHAIIEPSRLTQYPLQGDIADLLIKDTQGREGALPLLQFALSRIWQELKAGQQDPIQIYWEIGGVGGALAKQAESIYQENLSASEQVMAQRIFVGLAQLRDDGRVTRQRIRVDSLISHQGKPEVIRQVMGQFSAPAARLITLSSADGQEMAEITHEILFETWQRLKDWLNGRWQDIRFEQQLNAAYRFWDQHGRRDGSLWRSPNLEMLQDYYRRNRPVMTLEQLDFYRASITARRRRLGAIGVGAAAVLVAAVVSWQQWQERQVNELLALTTGDIVKPELLPAAERLVAKADRLGRSGQPAKVEAALSYYRAIIGFSQTLNATVSTQNQTRVNRLQAAAETGLVDLIAAERLGVLEAQLAARPPQIGDRTGAEVTDFENQFSAGALQTTYDILRRQEGAKADIYDSGQISTYREAERMPCPLLEAIARIWRERTQDACGWYDETLNHIFFDSDCDVLGGETLTAKVFNDPYDASIERLQICGLVPEDASLEYPF